MLSKASALSLLIAGGRAADLTNLPALLSNISASLYPDLRQISQNVWLNPEIGLDEHYAHDQVVNYFTNTKPGQWTVTPSSFGMPTAWTLEFENRPSGTPADADLPTIGVMAEYDALVGIHHACGHNHILLLGLSMASFARQAAIDLGIPARIIVQGTPDEENKAGKHTLLEAGAFDSTNIWLLGHPANANGVVPMNARLNIVAQFIEDTHAAAVKSAYSGMLAVRDIPSTAWPGTGSTGTPVEDVLNSECNVVQGAIAFGLEGPSLSAVQSSVSSLLATNTYPNVSCVVANDLNVKTGVNVTCLGPSGHASSTTNGPLVLSIELFRTYSATASNSFFLPGNMSSTELDITFDLRTRWTADLDAVAAVVDAAIAPTAKGTSTDTPYPSFEVPTQDLAEEVIRLVGLPAYGSQNNWILTPGSAASTDASWPQGNVVDPTTHAVTSADRVVLMPFWDLCDPNGGICAFNHDAAYAAVANTPYSYQQTEVMSRVMAHLLIELVNNSTMLANALSITKA